MNFKEKVTMLTKLGIGINMPKDKIKKSILASSMVKTIEQIQEVNSIIDYLFSLDAGLIKAECERAFESFHKNSKDLPYGLEIDENGYDSADRAAMDDMSSLTKNIGQA